MLRTRAFSLLLCVWVNISLALARSLALQALQFRKSFCACVRIYAQSNTTGPNRAGPQRAAHPAAANAETCRHGTATVVERRRHATNTAAAAIYAHDDDAANKARERERERRSGCVFVM